MIIEGCSFDPSKIESDNYENDVFKVKIDNLVNPREEIDTSLFKFEVQMLLANFRQIDYKLETLLYSDKFFIPAS